MFFCIFALPLKNDKRTKNLISHLKTKLKILVSAAKKTNLKLEGKNCNVVILIIDDLELGLHSSNYFPSFDLSIQTIFY